MKKNLTKNSLQLQNEGRRDFVKLMAMLSSGSILLPSFLVGCQGNEEVKTLTHSNDPFEILRILKAGLRKSPDHLLQQSKLILESKDPIKLFEFVRDRIQTIPNCCKYVQQNGSQLSYVNYRWGYPAATLRYGKGTWFEKSLLLKSLLAEAGFKSKILEGDFNFEENNIDDFFNNSQVQPFKADFSTQETMADSLPKGNFVSKAMIKDDDINKDLQNILSVLPANFDYPKIDWKKLQSKIYEVEVDIDGVKTRMNPSISNAVPGTSYFSGISTNERNDTIFGDTVNITLSLLSTGDVKKPIDFVTARIPIEKLMGNQVVISFQQHKGTRQYLLSNFKDIKTFTPAIGLAGLHLTKEDNKKYCFTGKSIHIDGDIFEVKGKQVILNGFDIPLSGDEHPAIRKIAKKIDAIIFPEKFPKVNLLFDVKDDANKILEGLGGKDFALYENEKPVTFTMLRNTQLPFRILLLFDLSNSIPAEFREIKKIAELAATVMREVKKAKPAALFKMNFFHLGRLFGKSNWTNDEQQLTSDITRINPADTDPALIGSELWTILSNATADQSINVVTFFTDGKANDELTPEISSKLLKGCPVLLLGVGEFDEKNLVEMAKQTNGKSTSINTPEEGINFLLNYLNSIPSSTYQIVFKGSEENMNERKVTLRVKETSVETIVLYTPTPSGMNTVTGWIGIFVTIDYQGQSCKRCLAGVSNFDHYNRNFSKADEKVTALAFFNDYRLVIERASPTPSVFFEEMIDRMLTKENYYKALNGNNVKALFDAIDKGFFTDPSGYLPVMSSFELNDGKNGYTYQDGLNAVLFSHCLELKGSLTSKVDILPFSKWRTAEINPKKAFEQNLRYSLIQLYLEKENFSISSMKMLTGKELQFLIDTDKWFNSFPTDDTQGIKQRWDEALGHNKTNDLALIVPKDFYNVAYYKLNKNSGSIFSILPDGSGGGSQEEVKEYFDMVKKIIDIFSFTVDKLGLVGPAFAVWVELAKWEAYWVCEASLAIASLGTDDYAGLDDNAMLNDLQNRAKDYVCSDVTSRATKKLFGKQGDEALALANQILGALNGPNMSLCGS